MSLFLALVALAQPVPAADPGPPPTALAILTGGTCPARRQDETTGEWLGDRAFVADDGGAALFQCGDASLWLWRAGEPGWRAIPLRPLFRAAQDTGILPAWLRCRWPPAFRAKATYETDCDVMGRAGDRNAYAVTSDGVIGTLFTPGGEHALSVWQRGVAMRHGTDRFAYVVDGERRPEVLQQLGLRNGTARTLARLPNPNLIFEDGGGTVSSVSYSAAHDLIVLSYSGAFRVARKMAYVRAYDTAGRERWAIEDAIPNPDDALIVGDGAGLLPFAGGRFAILQKQSVRDVATLIDLETGRAVGRIAGRPIATAYAARLSVVRHADGSVAIEPLAVSAN